MQHRRLSLVILSILAFCASFCQPLAASAQDISRAESALSNTDKQLYRQAFALHDAGQSADAIIQSRNAANPLLGWVIYGEALVKQGNFAEINAFVNARQGWPMEADLWAAAERQIPPDFSAREIINWFGARPPTTMQGASALINALRQTRNNGDAQKLASRFWRETVLPPSEQADFIRSNADYLNMGDHTARIDMLIWKAQFAAAQGLLGQLDPGIRAVAEARMALATDQSGVEAKLAAVPTRLQNDAGLLFERLRWRRERDDTKGAIDILNQAPADLIRADLWWRERHIIVRRLMERGDWREAYRLTAAHAQSSGFGFAQAEFLAGWIALRRLNQADRAIAHFQKLYDGVAMPVSKSRGAYWLGRAYDAKGERNSAQRWYQTAGEFPTTFYGQLALAASGNSEFTLPTGSMPSASAAATYLSRELPQAIAQLEAVEQNARAARYMRHLLKSGSREEDFQLAGALAQQLNRPDLAVLAAKAAQEKGFALPEQGYPVLPEVLAQGPTPEPALVLGLIRQESEFMSWVESPAGALGLMQLLPSTARDVARKLDESYSTERLTADPQFNIRLGSAYLAGRIDGFDGSYIMAIAAYNAGAGRVIEWRDSIGDPRTGAIDPIDWIELIPIYETRNYVQRVLENANIYRARLNRGKAPLQIMADIGITNRLPQTAQGW